MTGQMVCPKCGFEQPPADSCLKCGVVISKFIERQKETPDHPEKKPEGAPMLVDASRTSAAYDRKQALYTFRLRKIYYIVVLWSSLVSFLAGLYCIFFTGGEVGLYLGIGLTLGGLLFGIAGSFVVYRCPACGLFLWLSPGEPGNEDRDEGIKIYPPPSRCPNCDQPLR